MTEESEWLGVHSGYKPLDSTEGWLRCSSCGEHPRTWEFDNGRFAKCKCYTLYSVGVSAESIMAHVRANGGSVRHYDWDELRRNWNQHVLDQALDRVACTNRTYPNEEEYER